VQVALDQQAAQHVGGTGQRSQGHDMRRARACLVG
jgi:hypothetical protein